MRNYKTTSTHKGVPNHNIEAHNALDRIIVERWDETAEMMVEIAIRWQQFGEWEMLNWPRLGRVVGVQFDDRTRIGAKAYRVNFQCEPHRAEELFQSSMLCRCTLSVKSHHGEFFYGLPDLGRFARSKKTEDDVHALNSVA